MARVNKQSDSDSANSDTSSESEDSASNFDKAKKSEKIIA